MKKILLQLSIVIVLLFVAGCHTNIIDLDKYPDSGYGSSLDFDDRSQLNQRVSAEGHFCEVKFYSESGWRLLVENEENYQWITISSKESDKEGSYRVLFGVDENLTGVERKATFQLIGNGDSKAETIVITQSPIREDGTPPPPYEEDSYTDVVEKITIHRYYNGGDDGSTDEWRFVYDSPSSATIVSMDLFSLYPEPEGEVLNEQISIIDNRVIEHNCFGIKYPEQRYDLLYKKFIEFTMNDRNMITQMLVQDFDYSREEPNPEAIISDRNFSYANHRRVTQRTSANYNEIRCEWIDGNMIYCEAVDQFNGAINQSYSFTYHVRPNDRANIDLNSFLMDDFYSALGLHGKRCQNLFSSMVDSYHMRIDFQYTFDEQGRVATMAKQKSYDGDPRSERVEFEIHYRQ